MALYFTFTYILVHYYDLRSMDNGHCPMYKCIVYTLYIFCTSMHSYMPCTKNIHFSSTYYIVNTLYIFCKSMHPYRHCNNKIHFSSTSQWTEVHGHGRPNLHLNGSLTTSWMWKKRWWGDTPKSLALLLIHLDYQVSSTATRRTKN